MKVSSNVCTIYEIKPDNDAAKKRGYEQLKDQQRAVESLFGSRGAAGFADGKLRIFQRCVQEQKLELRGNLRVYAVCPSSFRIGEDWIDRDE